MAKQIWANHKEGEVQLQLWVPSDLRVLVHNAAAVKGMLVKAWVKQALEEKLEREKK